MKRKVKTMSIEDAIKEKFPDATIYEVRNDRFGKCILWLKRRVITTA